MFIRILKMFLICRKYGIRFRPWSKELGVGGSFFFSASSDGTLSIRIWVNVLSRGAEDTFFHELGHCLYHVRRLLGSSRRPGRSTPLGELMDEISASVFSRRVRKGLFDSDNMVRCLKTYSHYHYKIMKADEITEYTDTLVSGIRRIGGQSL